ncbi:hypothetical protein C3L33_11068, partial [Rhododendron williamsianum]
MAEKSKILIIGGTGYIGKFIVEASAKSSHPTFALGDLNDYESLVKAIKQVDVVISAVGSLQILDQTKIIAAIKEVGHIKRFFPSEFGNDVDRTRAVEPAKTEFAVKAQIRRAIEAEGIPHTIVSSNYFAGYFFPTLAQPGLSAPPRDKVIIPGDGNPKAVFNEEHDIGTYTIKAVDDPRTLNKIVYIKPPKNIYSFNELVSLWEKKIGKTLERIHVPEDEVLKQIQESPIPFNVIFAINHSVFVKGDQTYFVIEPSFGVEASELYPDVKYTTVEEYLDQFSPGNPWYQDVDSIGCIPWHQDVDSIGCQAGIPSTPAHSVETFSLNERDLVSRLNQQSFSLSFARCCPLIFSLYHLPGKIPMAEKSKILIIGGTGYIGKFIVEASAKSGHPTFALVRESTVSDPAKAKLIDGFKSSGVTLLHGDVNDHVSLVKAIKQVDVVISAVGSLQILDQTKIIAAIKEVGHIKRFFPSEFGNDVDHVNAVEPAKTAFALKAQIRRAIEAEGIPYTYVPSNFFAGYFLPTLAQPGLSAPPRDKVTIPGDGNPKGINFSIFHN